MKKTEIFHIILMLFIIVFSIYKVVELSVDLANYSLDMNRSYASLISGIILFSLSALIAGATLVYTYILKKRKELYRLKK